MWIHMFRWIHVIMWIHIYIAWIHTLHVNSYIVWLHTYHVNSYNGWILTLHVNSYIVWIHTLHVNSYIVWIHTLHVNSYNIWTHTLLARFPISGCNYLSLSLEQRRWQKRYCSCPGNGNIRHHCPWSTNTHGWGLRSACNHVVWHDGFHSSCCLSKSENESKSKKEIWNKINSFFQTNCRHSMKRTGHCAMPRHSFSWSDRACDHPSCCRTCCYSHPCHRVDHDHGVNRLDEDSQVGDCQDHTSRFDGSHDICGNGAACSSIHGYVR